MRCVGETFRLLVHRPALGLAIRFLWGVHAVYVACSTLCFSGAPLDDALRSIREMNFAKADIAVREQGGHLKPSDLLGDLTKICQRIKASNVPVAAFHAAFPQPDGELSRSQLRAVSRLARLLAAPLVSVPAADIGADFAKEVERLTGWYKIASAEGVILTIETDSQTLTADPDMAAELCRLVPGLGISLDPSHYIAAPTGPKNYDCLYPFVRHVRLRDSGNKPDAFQVRVGQGDLEYGRIITQLDRCRYDRALSVDVRNLPMPSFPVEPEVRKLKYLLESLV